jgi:hypothetical protein
VNLVLIANIADLKVQYTTIILFKLCVQRFCTVANFHNVPLSVPTNQALTQYRHAHGLSMVPVWLTLPDGKSKLTGKPENLL